MTGPDAGPSRPARPQRSDYVAWRTATTRWADDDVYGHMNNAAYFELIDTAVNAHLVESTGLDVRTLPAIGVVAEVSCRYFAEMRFPRPVELGLVAERVGSSSVVYRVGLFQGDGEDACAEGRFVHVYVAQPGGPGAPGTGGGPRPVVPIPAEIRDVAEALLAPEPA
ncbi:acyl-CoA thioesterase [Nocardioides sp. HDW12B]|uniref:acyl-CoA thioesterase n=1 Tax=Nocardioides sp. HDW12B TaxID=2714939 RepID=UPI001409B387|nr:acyl-CoA thioesterase [Nocardioides sp. HDW12B]QIK66994.1 acyl-CoA thioesterase [Nocardioides sp. HDW12B]